MKNKVFRQFFYSCICILAGMILFIFFIYFLKWQLCDILYLLFNLVCIESCLIISFVTNILEVENQNKTIIYEKALSRKSVWLKSYITWLVVHYWLIGSSLMATVNVIYIGIDSMDQKRIIMYSILSLFLACVGYVLSPLTISIGYRKAYCNLDNAILFYEQDKNKEDMILDAISNGEKFITEYTFEKK